MAASQNTVAFTITQADKLGSSVLTRSKSATFAGTFGEFEIGNLPSSSQTTIPLPTSPTYQFTFANTSSAGSIVLTQTAQNSSASIALPALGPGGIHAMWNAASSSTYGITALLAAASSANVPYEIFLGG